MEKHEALRSCFFFFLRQPDGNQLYIRVRLALVVDKGFRIDISSRLASFSSVTIVTSVASASTVFSARCVTVRGPGFSSWYSRSLEEDRWRVLGSNHAVLKGNGYRAPCGTVAGCKS